MSGTTQVYLEASPITPADNGEITITDENKFQQDGGTDNYFNGEINGEAVSYTHLTLPTT